MSFFEALMLICFGASWPVSIWKTVKVKNPVGKSIFFLYLVELGYISGIVNKLIYSPNWVTWLYVLNALMVGIDIVLVLRYTSMRSKGLL